MGDGKDHATLLQTLLRAKGIESTQALVNSGGSFKLAKIPAVENINHVINYLPKYDLFLDSTAQGIPFGYLPFSITGKPVLLVDNFVEGKKTPLNPVASNQEVTKSIFKINADGSAKVEMEVKYKGMVAATSRSRFKDITADEEADYLSAGLTNMGHKGKGTIKTDDRTEVTDEFGYKASFEIKNFLKNSAAAFRIFPPLPTEAPLRAFVRESDDKAEKFNVTCSSGQTSEELVFEFPKNRKILNVPEDFESSNAILSYRARYKQNGNVVTVKREFVDKTPGNICSPLDVAQYEEFVSSVLPNYGEQIMYK